jgi:hypothetical protein
MMRFAASSMGGENYGGKDAFDLRDSDHYSMLFRAHVCGRCIDFAPKD